MRTPVPNVNLRPDHWAIVRCALLRHVPDRDVLVFGSRATWTAKEYSDLDLAIMGDEPLLLREVTALDEALSESDLPFKVDIVEWARIDDGIRGIIREHGVVVRDAAKNPSRPWERSAPNSGVESEWPEIPFAQVLALPVRSGVYKRKEFHGHGVKIVNMKELFAYPRLGNVPMRRVNLTEKEIARFCVCKGDLLFARRSLVAEGAGKCSVIIDISEPTAFESSIIRARPDVAKADSLFLYYFFNSPRGLHALDSIRRHVAVAGITGGDLVRLNVPKPALPQQRAIAHILGTLDDKIELNRRMNETLEAMARALFKSWFVDFDPVRAKMAGRETGLPQDIANLFPDRLVDSEMGEIPEGWVVKSLKDCMNLTMGQSPPGSTYNEKGEGLPFFQGRSNFGFRYPQKRRFCSAPNRMADPEDTLVSVRAPVGDINLAWERCCIGRGVAALRHKSGSSSFTYHSAWALNPDLKKYEHTGTVFGAINKGQFEALEVIEPDPQAVHAFDFTSKHLDARIRSNVSESRTLAALRDTLLPKLISGEIRVTDAEWALESNT